MVRFEDIKNSLTESTCAVEFTHFRYFSPQRQTDTIYYGAILIKGNQTVPEFILLCEENKLINLLQSAATPEQFYITRGQKKDDNTPKETVKLKTKTKANTYGHLGSVEGLPTHELYNLLYKPLKNNLKGITNIYYTPSGLLYRIAFNALVVNDAELLSDQYQLHALSSTRTIYTATLGDKKGDDAPLTSALLYGGIRFDDDSLAIEKGKKQADEEEVVRKNEKYKKRAEDDFENKPRAETGESLDKKRGSIETEDAATHWEYLEGTKREVERIAALFAKYKKPAKLLKGFSASEDYFKKMVSANATSPAIVHLATHGFFYSKKAKNADHAFQSADNPLIRSGLILAGANHAWLGGKPYQNQENGILTAYEIANLNLSNTKVVVLSACETGLGDIQGSEGVYGLQRAFKMAGVDYILMSLWKVPDKQTAELMEKFYTFWLKGNSIETAFNLAQQDMRTRYLPYHWAGFVLMR